jgi:hypothetical protein
LLNLNHVFDIGSVHNHNNVTKGTKWLKGNQMGKETWGMEEATKWTRNKRGHTGQRVPRARLCTHTSIKPRDASSLKLNAPSSPPLMAQDLLSLQWPPRLLPSPSHPYPDTVKLASSSSTPREANIPIPLQPALPNWHSASLDHEQATTISCLPSLSTLWGEHKATHNCMGIDWHVVHSHSCSCSLCPSPSAPPPACVWVPEKHHPTTPHPMHPTSPSHIVQHIQYWRNEGYANWRKHSPICTSTSLNAIAYHRMSAFFSIFTRWSKGVISLYGQMQCFSSSDHGIPHGRWFCSLREQGSISRTSLYWYKTCLRSAPACRLTSEN